MHMIRRRAKDCVNVARSDIQHFAIVLELLTLELWFAFAVAFLNRIARGQTTSHAAIVILAQIPLLGWVSNNRDADICQLHQLPRVLQPAATRSDQGHVDSVAGGNVIRSAQHVSRHDHRRRDGRAGFQETSPGCSRWTR